GRSRLRSGSISLLSDPCRLWDFSPLSSAFSPLGRGLLLLVRLSELLLLILDEPADHLPPQRLGKLGRQAHLGGSRTHAIDHLLDTPGRAGFRRRGLELPGAIDIGEALADEIDKRLVDPVDLRPHLIHVAAVLGFARRHRFDPLAGYDRIGLDLDQIVRVHEGRDLKRRVGGTDVAEEFAVDAADRLEVSHIDEIHARANHVLEARAGLGERLPDRLENGPGLRRRVAFGDGLAARAGRSPRDGDDIADANGAGEADDRLVRTARGDQTSLARYIIHAALLHQSLGFIIGPAASSITRA